MAIVGDADSGYSKISNSVITDSLTETEIEFWAVDQQSGSFGSKCPDCRQSTQYAATAGPNMDTNAQCERRESS